MQGEISVREPLGDEIIYEVRVGENIIRAKTEPTLLLHPGDKVGLNFAMDRIHVFDAHTEKVIEFSEMPSRPPSFPPTGGDEGGAGCGV